MPLLDLRGGLHDFLLCIAAQRKPSLAVGEKTVAAVSAASEDFAPGSPMTDSLRTRIAAAIESIRIQRDGDAAQMADAVIRELCLHREDMNEWAVLANGFRGHRYVTHWEENETPVVKIRSAEKLGLTGDGE